MRKIILLSAAILSLAACSADKAESISSVNTVPQPVAEADNLVIKGQLTYRERIALRPGLTAKVTLSDVSIADRKAPVLATQQFELRGLQVPIPFEISVPSDQLKPRGRYAVRGTLIGPEGAKLWTTDTTYLIDPAKPTQDIGSLNIVRTEARRRTRVNFFDCGGTNVETRVTEDNMVLIVNQEEYNLPKVPAASGVKYREGSGADKVVFWNQGDIFMLQVGAKTFPECTIIDLK